MLNSHLISFTTISLIHLYTEKFIQVPFLSLVNFQLSTHN
jgi:hypothetical protein